MSSSACARRARARPSARRSGGRTYEPARNAAPAPPSGPVTTSTSPGSAPARPGTRSLRPSAVTEMSDRAGRGRVAADDRHARLGDPLVERDHGRRLACSPAAARRDEQRLRNGARRGEVAQVDGGGAKPELAPADPVEAKVHALDERVLRDDEIRPEQRGVVLDADDQPAPFELREEPELTALREPRQPPSSRSDRRPRGSSPRRRRRRAMHSPRSTRRCRRSRSPARGRRRRSRGAPSRPDRRRRVRLRRRLPDRPGAEIVGVGRARLLERRRPSGRAGGRCARARAAPASSWPRCTPSAPSASAASTSSLTTNVTPSSAKPCAALDDLGRRPLHAQLHDGGAGGDGPTRRLEIGDERMHLHDVRALASSVAGSSAASAS